jgi:protein-serine/threonine kinase
MNQNLGELEDLHRFPMESLHSFSFAQQSEELLHSRQNILKRSIDFMRDRMGWAASNHAIASAQANMSGDADIQGMMDLLTRAHVLNEENATNVRGPTTGPADVNGDNIFEKAFADHGPSPISTRDEP